MKKVYFNLILFGCLLMSFFDSFDLHSTLCVVSKIKPNSEIYLFRIFSFEIIIRKKDPIRNQNY